MKINLLISAFVFAAAIFAFIYFVQSRDSAEIMRQKAIIQEAEKMKNKQISGAKFVDVKTDNDLSDEIFNGDVFAVVLVSGCEACTKQAKMMSEMTFDGNPKVFGIMIEDRHIAERYIADNNIKIPIVIVKEGHIPELSNLRYFPTNLRLLDGKITNVQFGSFINSEKLSNFLNKP